MPGSSYPGGGYPGLYGFLSRAAIATVTGVAVVASVGQVVATGTVVVSVTVGPVWRPAPWRRAPIALDATAYPRGVSARAAVGRVRASGGAVSQPDGVAMAAAVGRAGASGGAVAAAGGVSLAATLGRARACHVQAMARHTAIAAQAVPRGVRVRCVSGTVGARGAPDALDQAWMAMQAQMDEETDLLLLGVFD